jgi:hypothetical protein
LARDAFVGTSDATREPSITRSSKVTAEVAHRHYVDVLNLESAGTWGVTVTEIGDANCRAVDDSACDEVVVPGHSFIDMRDLPKADAKSARARLATLATARGCQHGPQTS